MKRFLALTVVLFVGAMVWRISAHETAHGPNVKPVMSHEIQEKVDGIATRAVMAEVTWQGGDFSEAHRHPGPTFVYVLEGEIETQVEDGPIVRLKPGDTLYEPSMALHRLTRNMNPDKPAKILAFHLTPTDAKELVIPEPTEK
ncbi:cupin domain-containing protein [Blastopirellula sp. JC732]|uniref:Cupin domain-containing protein n=1 Tax=Blastopirellula sediminis TaxID=2894196 RepID=A0A9X1MMK8_9BACT|nr:cupin domain-containing protein [Blastopirellula sediminis]MCC9606790.1 cupin domain-containing protein [Blastopirellula sediminis]MCC9629913.1 cupin domain-containing protein [Blastopirellula sediminis]